MRAATDLQTDGVAGADRRPRRLPLPKCLIDMAVVLADGLTIADTGARRRFTRQQTFPNNDKKAASERRNTIDCERRRYQGAQRLSRAHRVHDHRIK